MSDSSIVKLFDAFEARARSVLEKLAGAGEVDALLVESRKCFARLAPEMPYIEHRDHLMWDSTLAVFQWLAVHLATREQGIDAHQLGRAMLEAGAREGTELASEVTDELVARALRDSVASQKSAPENEFVFEIVPGEDENTDWGMNVTRCAVCHAYSKHDAMAFTPYMCATDDLVSDQLDQGLRRTGTIALGAHRCDFRYKAGGDPLRLAEQYPEKIQSGASIEAPPAEGGPRSSSG
jgi:hypothetical protein